MTLLIVIDYTFIGIKNNFFLSMNLCTLKCVIFSGITWPSCLPFFFFLIHKDIE